MNRPCPHRDDEACSVCVENAALRAQVTQLREQVGRLEDELELATAGRLW